MAATSDTMAACKEIMQVRSGDVLSRTMKWMEGRHLSTTTTTNSSSVGVTFGCAALLSRLLVSIAGFRTNSSVESTCRPTSSTPLKNTITNSNISSSFASPSTEQPSLDVKEPSRSFESGLKQGDNELNESDEAIAHQDTDHAVAEEKARSPIHPPTIPTGSTGGETLRGNLQDDTGTDGNAENSDSGIAFESPSPLSTSSSSLTGLANDLADFLRFKCEDEEVADLKGIVSQCLFLFENEDLSSNNEAAIDLYRSVLGDSTQDSDGDLELEGEHLRLLITSALHAIRDSTTIAVESFVDFHYIWNMCCDNDAFRVDMKLLDRCPTNDEDNKDKVDSERDEPVTNENRKRSREVFDASTTNKELSTETLDQMKECAWKLSCVITMQHRLSRSKGRTSQGNVDIEGIEDRRSRLLTITTCIGLMPWLSSEFISTKDSQETEGNYVDEPNLKKSYHPLNGKEYKAGLFKHDERSCAQTKGALISRKRLSIEDDAIAALSMMVSGATNDCSALDNNAPPENLVESPTRDSVDGVLNASHALHTSLGLPLGEEISRAVLEANIEIAAKMFCAPIIDSNGASIPSIGTMKTSPKEDDSAKSPVTLALRLRSTPRIALSRVTDAKYIEQEYRNLLTQVVMPNSKLIPNPSELNKLEVIKAAPYVDEVRLCSIDANSIARFCHESEQKRPDTKGGKTNTTKRISYSPSQVAISSEPQEAAELVSSLRSNGSSDPMVADAIDLNEWTVSILELSKIKPNTRLLLYLDASDDEGAKINKRKRYYNGSTGDGTVDGWRDVIIPVLNRALERMKETSNGDSSSNFVDVAAISVSREDGEILCEGEVLCDEDEHARVSIVGKKICAAVVALYYEALEKILFHETARLKSASHPKLIQSCAFHRGLLSCSFVCILKAIGASGILLLSGPHKDLDLRSVLQVMECAPYTYLKVSESFTRSLQSNQKSKRNATKSKGMLRNRSSADLPRILQQHLRHCEVLIMDSLLWAHDRNFGMGGTVMDVVRELQRTPLNGRRDAYFWPPDILQPNLPEEFDDAGYTLDRTQKEIRTNEDPDHVYMSYLLRKLLKVSYFRISALCSALEILPEYPIASQIWVAFRYLLRHHVELLYDRHVDQIILCTLYGVCKIMKFEPELTFAKIIEVYTKARGREIGERECQRIVRHIKLYPNEEKQAGNFDESRTKAKSKRYGNVIHLYNHVFVPSMKNHLLQSKSLKKATLDLRKIMTDEGCPELVRSSEAATSVVDRAINPSNGHCPGPIVVPVAEGNVTLNVRLPGLPFPFATSTKRPKPRGRPSTSVSIVEVMAPKSRALYSFGGAHVKDLDLLNCMVSQT